LTAIDLSVVMPALGEGENLAVLLPRLRAVLSRLRVSTEVLVVTRGDDVGARASCDSGGAELVEENERGYGRALLAGIRRARGRYVLTMDADLSHPPSFVEVLWRERESAEILIASRYVPGGRARMPLRRKLLSLVLNRFFARGLALTIRDMSSGFRLYRADILRELPLPVTSNFDILQQILTRLYAEGWRVRELPFDYEPRLSGSSHARVIPFGIAYLRTFRSLWRLRNSISSADYDLRAHDSVIPLQRYWQRRRLTHVTALAAGGRRALDAGCGSSRILGALPEGTVGMDILARKLRCARRFGRPLVRGSVGALPFRAGAFDCVVCSQVIEHLPRHWPVLEELVRVLAPGGRLVLGTPDYGSWRWRLLEWAYARVAPGAYAEEHVTRYDRRQLLAAIERFGLELEEERSILGAELILALRKQGPV
jgi:dolichol-phosphate mannosyltransferase